MELRGKQIRWAPMILLVGCLVAGPLALGAQGAPHHLSPIASKKCKKKHGQKKRHCKRRPAAPASISISPMSADFGIQSLDTTTRSFTITNIGGSPSGLPVPMIVGPTPASFSLGANTCANALPPAVSCQIDVNFHFAGSSGPQSATLNVTAVPGGMVSAAMTGDFEA